MKPSASWPPARGNSPSLPQHRMLVQHVLPDRLSLDRAKQDPRRRHVIGPYAQVDDLADGGIAHQIVRNLHGDFHRGLGGALVAFGVALALLAVGLVLAVDPAWKTADPFGTIAGGPADVADLVGRLDVSKRPLDLLLPDFLVLALAEPPHRPSSQRLHA